MCSVVSNSLQPSMEYSPLGSSVHETFQIRILEWAVICFSRGSSQSMDWTRVSCNSCTGWQMLYHCAIWEAESWFMAQLSPRWSLCVCVCGLSQVQLFKIPWTIVHKAPLTTGFPRQEYWSGLPFHSSGGLPDSGVKLVSPMSPVLAAIL